MLISLYEIVKVESLPLIEVFLSYIYGSRCCLLLKTLKRVVLNPLFFLFQLVIDRVPELDLRRTFVFTFLGLALVGPTLHIW